MFDRISDSPNDAAQLFEQAAHYLVETGNLHELFDLRLLEQRYELGLPLDRQPSFDEVPAPQREQLEQTYLKACREVGSLLLDRGQASEAWTYLRPAGEKAMLREWLAQAVPRQENADQLIELALYETIDPERGFAWLLAQRGTCNAITEFDAMAGRLSPQDLTACAAVLVRHLHAELLGNLLGHLQQLDQPPPAERSVVAVLAAYPQLLDEGAFHVDTSHLASTVRYARSLTEPKLVKLAIDLATYGSRLAKDLQYPDQPPFEDLYASHLLLFRATVGDDPQAAIDYFREQAAEVSTEHYGTSAIEAYLIVLNRANQNKLAMEEYARLVPAGQGLSQYAPTLLELAQRCHDWQRYFELCQERQDAVGYAAGLLTKANP